MKIVNFQIVDRSFSSAMRYIMTKLVNVRITRVMRVNGEWVFTLEEDK